MAQTIVASIHGDFIIGPGCLFNLADQTGTTAAQQLIGTGGRNIAATWFSAMVSLKTFVVGTGTVYPMFALEVADNSAFTLNKRRIATYQPILIEAIGAIPGANPIVTFLIEGFSPDAGKNFVRLVTTFNGTSTGVYDAIVYGA